MYGYTCTQEGINRNIHWSFVYNTKNLQPTKFPFVEEQINILWYIHTVEGNALAKRNNQSFIALNYISDTGLRALHVLTKFNPHHNPMI